MKLTINNKIRTAKILLAVIATAAISVIVPVESFALNDTAGEKLTPPVTVNIPVTHRISGNSGSKEEYLFTLTAEKPDNPMPEGSEKGTITIKVKGGEKIDFGDITIEHPDTFYYKVSRADNRDDRSYRVMIAAFRDGSHEMIAWESGADGKAEEIIFEDKFGGGSDKSGPPKTGDELNVIELVAIASAVILCMTALAALIMKRMREDQYDK